MSLAVCAGGAVAASLPAAADPPVPLSCTMIVDPIAGGILHQEGECERRFAPMSTFKLPLALMGFDAGILENERMPRWEYDPAFDGYPNQRKTTDPTLWEKESIVWYSQEITRKLGMERFKAYVDDFHYGNMDVSGDPGQDNGLTRSWLYSSLEISPVEQIDFLMRFFDRQHTASQHAYAMTEAIVPSFKAADGWVLYGKTGSGWWRAANDVSGSEADSNARPPLGWFVGWAEKGGRGVLFVRMAAELKKKDGLPLGPKMRDAMVRELPVLMKGKEW